MPAPISIVIPTLNAGDALPETANALLSGVGDGLVRELIISDGGSGDDTCDIAGELGAILVTGPPGRGGQIARGVARARGDWLLILHADTHLSPDWPDAVRHHMALHPEQAGWFRLRFRARGHAARLVAAGANLRATWASLPYGDQGLFVHRTTLSEVGGIPEIPLMEDVVLARRLKARLRPLPATAATSAEKYEHQGWARRVARNLLTLARFKLGADPATLSRAYNRQGDSPPGT